MRLRYGVNEEPNAHTKNRVRRLHHEIHVNRVARYASQQVSDIENGIESPLKVLPPSLDERDAITRVVEELLEEQEDAITDTIDSFNWMPKELRVYLVNAIQAHGDLNTDQPPTFKYFRFDTIGQPPSPDTFHGGDPGPRTSDK